jgi:hypothetical protein
MPRQAQPITLSPTDQTELKSWVAAHRTPQQPFPSVKQPQEKANIRFFRLQLIPPGPFHEKCTEAQRDNISGVGDEPNTLLFALYAFHVFVR